VSRPEERHRFLRPSLWGGGKWNAEKSLHELGSATTVAASCLALSRRSAGQARPDIVNTRAAEPRELLRWEGVLDGSQGAWIWQPTPIASSLANARFPQFAPSTQGWGRGFLGGGGGLLGFFFFFFFFFSPPPTVPPRTSSRVRPSPARREAIVRALLHAEHRIHQPAFPKRPHPDPAAMPATGHRPIGGPSLALTRRW